MDLIDTDQEIETNQEVNHHQVKVNLEVAITNQMKNVIVNHRPIIHDIILANQNVAKVLKLSVLLKRLLMNLERIKLIGQTRILQGFLGFLILSWLN